MAGISATAGSDVYIGGPQAAQSADFVQADFNTHSWVALEWLENIGQFGDESSEITFDAIGEGRTQKLKGIRNAGNLELVMGIDWEAVGQAAIRQAQLSPLDFAFRIDFNDAPSGGSPSQRFFIAKVMTARESLEGANNVIKLNATLGINSNIVIVNAF